MYYLTDYHTHSLISPDSEAPLARMVEMAAAAGIREYCVTDHADLLDWHGKPDPNFNWAGAREQYRALTDGLRLSIQVRLGLELGSAPHSPADGRRILEQGGEALDFVLGSIHNWIGAEGNIDMYFTRFSHDPHLCRRAMDNYLDSVWALVRRCPDCYDALAHLPYPLRYMERDGQTLSLLDYQETIREILAEVARTGHALKINTNRGTSMDWWPTLLRWFRAAGGNYVTMGSDAHRPEDVAKGIPEACALLQAAGFRHVTTYVKRQPVLHELA